MIKLEHPVLESLSKMSLEFIPTGSRYLGTAQGSHSDYDFFLAVKDYSEYMAAAASLKALGFESVTVGGYCEDDDLFAVLRHRVGGQSPQVDVLIGKHEVIEHRIEVFKRLRALTQTRGERVMREFTDAMKRSKSWGLVFDLAACGNEPRS